MKKYLIFILFLTLFFVIFANVQAITQRPSDQILNRWTGIWASVSNPSSLNDTDFSTYADFSVYGSGAYFYTQVRNITFIDLPINASKIIYYFSHNVTIHSGDDGSTSLSNGYCYLNSSGAFTYVPFANSDERGAGYHNVSFGPLPYGAINNGQIKLNVLGTGTCGSDSLISFQILGGSSQNATFFGFENWIENVIDNTPPFVNVTNATDGDFIIVTPVTRAYTFSVNNTEDSVLYSCFYSLNGGANTTYTCSNGITNKQVTGFKIGENNISFYAKNDAGSIFSQALTLNAGTTVCVDIDHPDYGINYSCGTPNATFLFNITYFRKILFANGENSLIIPFNSTFYVNDTGLKISSHQYDEVVGLSLNISTNSSLKEPVFYCANTSTVDRIYQGSLIGDRIYLNTTHDYNSTKTLTDSNGNTNKVIYFYLDDNIGVDYIFLFNLTGSGYGTAFFDDFLNNTNIDEKNTTADIRRDVIITNGTEKAEFTFDEFNDGVIDSRWEKSADYSYSEDCSISVTNSETNGYLLSHNVWSNGGYCSGSTTAYVFSNSSYLNLISSDDILFKLNATYNSEADNTGCSGNSFVDLGGTNIWTSMFLSDNGVGNDVESSQADLVFNLSFYNKTDWRVKISGIETSYVYHGDSTCDGITRVNNWTSGTYIQDGAGTACDSSGSLDNDFFISYNYLSPPVKFYNTVSVGSACRDNVVDTKIYYVNNTLFKRYNSTVISEPVYESDGLIDKATITSKSLYYEGDTSTNGYLYLSADNGTTWENAQTGVEHTFSNPGDILRWRLDFKVNNEGTYLNSTIWLDYVNISTPTGSPSNVTIDWGNDGTIDWIVNGVLNSTNTPVTINISGVSLINGILNATKDYSHLSKIPLVFKSETPGTMTIDTINLTYNPNPVVLNISYIQDYLNNSSGYTNFTIPLGSIGGVMNITDLRYDYAGGNDTISVLVYEQGNKSNNDTLNLVNFFSKWDYEFVPKYVDYLEFIPKSPTSKNVTPYGQTSSTAILNLTNYGYGGKTANLSIWLNGTESCVNLTLSLTNNKSEGYLINESWRQLTVLDYLDTTNIFMWADYACNYSTWRYYSPDIYFRQCAKDVDVCSEDII